MNSLLKKEIIGALQLMTRPLTSKSFGNECLHFDRCPINFAMEWTKGSCSCISKNYIGIRLCLEETTQGHEEVFKLLLVKLASMILLKILGILIRVWDTSFKMHSHKLKKMKNLVTPSFNASYHMWGRQRWHSWQ